MKTTVSLATLLLLLGSNSAFSQVQLAPADSLQPAVRKYRNIVRLDGLAILSRNRNRSFLFEKSVVPVLLGYERQIGRQFSVTAEVLLNAGKSDDQITGVALQTRYYIPQSRYPNGLNGFYVAPTFGVRRAKQSKDAFPLCYGSPSYTIAGRSQTLGGAGLLAGRQTDFKRGRFLIDASIGLMSWTPLDKSAVPYGCEGVSNDLTKYQRHTFVLDGRLGVGYRF